jgi:hypothetical protein
MDHSLLTIIQTDFLYSLSAYFEEEDEVGSHYRAGMYKFLQKSACYLKILGARRVT